MVARRSAPPEARSGVYLDGGFGVGKTHLLAALWHVSEGPKAFGTFVEYTNLVGALGFTAAVEAFSAYRTHLYRRVRTRRPGDTVLMSTFLGNVVERGVRVAATSNTLPDRLGRGDSPRTTSSGRSRVSHRTSNWCVSRGPTTDIAGKWRPALPSNPPNSNDWPTSRRTRPTTPSPTAGPLTYHPSLAVRPLVADLELLCLADVRRLTDQADALRLVVLVDRLYDADGRSPVQGGR